MGKSGRAVEGPLGTPAEPQTQKHAIYLQASGLAQPLEPAAEGQRFTTLEWWEQDPNEDKCYSHVLLFRGFDLSAAGILAHDIAPCLLCAPLPPDHDPALILTEETLHWGRLIHFVCCGDCGTRGPWADNESQALALWNAAHKRATNLPPSA